MEAKRWIQFRTELNEMYLEMKSQLDNPIAVDMYFQKLAGNYPELHKVKEVKEIKHETSLELFILQDVVKEIEAKIKVNPELPTETQQEVKEINQKVNEDPTHQASVNTETEQDCLDTLSIVNKTIIETKKQLIHLRSQQGKVLCKLRDITKCNMSDLVKKTDYSPSPYSLEFV